MSDSKKDHVRLMFGSKLPPQQPSGDGPQAISGKEQYRALINRNRAFGAMLMEMNKRKPPDDPKE